LSTNMQIRIINICGARPNFMKIAPLMAVYKSDSRILPYLVHTGQHYDEKMSDLFFRQLEIPEPDINLEVGSASHAVQTAEIMKRFEPVVLDFRPDYVLVVGDVNSTIACGLVAQKLGVRLIHVEAGLRSFDRMMPEEVNRVLTDAISDLLFVTERAAIENLTREGVSADKIHFVGNVMIDTLLKHLDKARQTPVLANLGLTPGQYGLVTLHRPGNVDDPERLSSILEGLFHIARSTPLLFPVHPRTKKIIETMGWARKCESANLRLVEPFGYLEFLNLMSSAMVVLTDSGGIQEETTVLGVACFTLRENTERPVTIAEGTNRLVTPGRDAIIEAWNSLHRESHALPRRPELWDGLAAQRIVAAIVADFTERHKA
jgi:UDP-N-acetylglucosamine 2-epimerase (non-hydrolysing)